jgi:hypothetical protein
MARLLLLLLWILSAWQIRWLLHRRKHNMQLCLSRVWM